MTVICVLVTYLLCVAGLTPHFAALQKAHYRPFVRPEARQTWVWAALFVYTLALYLCWPWVMSGAAWTGIYLLAAFLPQAVWLAVRVPHLRLRYTARLARLYLTATLLLAVPAGLAIAYPRCVYPWGLWATASYAVAQAASVICYPLEEARNKRFCQRQSLALERSGVCVIGVTGSAGKTTVKRLITAALGECAYATCGNYNTPLGIALSIRDMPAGTRWFVAEMGVGKPGDMRELLSVVHPLVGVVTCILPQHTGRFERVEDIRQEKCRLLDHVEWGLCHTSVGYPAHATFGEGGDVWAEDVRLERDATQLTVCEREGKWRVRIPLVGRQTVDNALCAWAVARHLGVSAADIISRWQNVRGEPHRLAVTRSDRGVWIVDDSYNCNVRGAAYALEYIGLFEGRKVVAVSGIDEADERLGLNVELGRMIAEKADVVVIVGDRFRQELCEGLGDSVPVYSVPSTAQSVELYRRLLREGDVLLIMADYPM